MVVELLVDMVLVDMGLKDMIKCYRIRNRARAQKSAKCRQSFSKTHRGAFIYSTYAYSDLYIINHHILNSSTMDTKTKRYGVTDI